LKDNKITATQWTIWIITALLGPIIFFAKGDWFGTLIVGCVFTALSWVVCRYGKHWRGSVYCIFQIVWISILLSQLLLNSADCWPTAQKPIPIIPITMLLLAGAAALKGEKSAANGVGVLFWVASVLLGAVIISGIGDVKLSFLSPTQQLQSNWFILAFLLPASVSFIKRENSSVIPFIAVVLIAVSICLWIGGILSAEVAKDIAWPFYEAAKSVQLLDIAQRLEALVSVGVTVGYYALFSLLLCEVGSIGKIMGHELGAIAASTIISVCLVLSRIRIGLVVIFAACMIFWVILPLLGTLKTKNIE